MKNLLPYDGTLSYNQNFYSDEKAIEIFNALKTYPEYEQRIIKIFGKEINAPRLEAFYSKNKQNYSYSGQTLQGNIFTPMIEDICMEVEAFTGACFNSVLINVYRDGQDSNGWHSDNEKELGINPVIASLSFGASRNIHFRHNKTNLKKTIEMENGSIMVMGGTIQHHWKHQVPKTSKVKSTRINMTFRWIIS